ncbi:hypothetical protein Fmac_012230 [Flemingia macrophylla]|uniref:TFIIB-type domain-containing protein n=1 Tax=Flemingia macrophylla TaxID=520843 RepID=A0ABD1MPP6_9FABA
MSDAFCSDCKRQTKVVFDHSGGDTVCSECGLVLESHSIDETSKWRIFANESGDNDPVRVGSPTNPLLTDGGLSTVIAKPNGGSDEFLSSSLGRWQNRGSNLDRALILAFKTIATMSNRMHRVKRKRRKLGYIFQKLFRKVLQMDFGRITDLGWPVFRLMSKSPLLLGFLAGLTLTFARPPWWVSRRLRVAWAISDVYTFTLAMSDD